MILEPKHFHGFVYNELAVVFHTLWMQGGGRQTTCKNVWRGDTTGTTGRHVTTGFWKDILSYEMGPK